MNIGWGSLFRNVYKINRWEVQGGKTCPSCNIGYTLPNIIKRLLIRVSIKSEHPNAFYRKIKRQITAIKRNFHKSLKFSGFFLVICPSLNFRAYSYILLRMKITIQIKGNSGNSKMVKSHSYVIRHFLTPHH